MSFKIPKSVSRCGSAGSIKAESWSPPQLQPQSHPRRGSNSSGILTAEDAGAGGDVSVLSRAGSVASLAGLGVDEGYNTGYFSSPSISGKMLAFLCEDDIWQWDITRRERPPVRVTADGSCWALCFSPCARWIAYTSGLSGSNEVPPPLHDVPIMAARLISDPRLLPTATRRVPIATRCLPSATRCLVTAPPLALLPASPTRCASLTVCWRLPTDQHTSRFGLSLRLVVTPSS